MSNDWMRYARQRPSIRELTLARERRARERAAQARQQLWARNRSLEDRHTNTRTARNTMAIRRRLWASRYVRNRRRVNRFAANVRRDLAARRIQRYFRRQQSIRFWRRTITARRRRVRNLLHRGY